MIYNNEREGKLGEIIKLFMQAFQKYCLMEKQPMDFGNGIKLYHAEIHTIADIGENPEINITDLAKIQSVTKGAVSQQVNKLVRKQYVAKFKGDNEKELKLRLTDKGMIAFQIHEAYHSSAFEEYNEIYKDTTEKEQNLLKKVLKAVIKNIDCKLKD